MKIAQVEYSDPKSPRNFSQSLRDTGFAVLKGHPIPAKLLEEVYSGWADFFSRPSKQEYLFDSTRQSGFFPFRTENAKHSAVKDLKEFFHVYPGTVLPSVIQSSTIELRDQLIHLAEELLGWLQEQTDAEVRNRFSMPLPQMIEGSHLNLFRILHYPPLPGDIESGAVRAAAHEDINLITLLPAATTPGLEVRDVSNHWHRVPCDPGSIVVNAGDMLQLASNGYYRSTTHQVVNPKGEEAKSSRYSMPLFLHPRPDVLLGKEMKAKDYLEQRLKEIGLK